MFIYLNRGDRLTPPPTPLPPCKTAVCIRGESDSAGQSNETRRLSVRMWKFKGGFLRTNLLKNSPDSDAVDLQAFFFFFPLLLNTDGETLSVHASPVLGRACDPVWLPTALPDRRSISDIKPSDFQQLAHHHYVKCQRLTFSILGLHFSSKRPGRKVKQFLRITDNSRLLYYLCRKKKTMRQ